jgi:hypothetical protein
MIGVSALLMYLTQHVIGTSLHPIAPWVKDLAGLTPLGLALRVSETLENYITQYNLSKKHDE